MLSLVLWVQRDRTVMQRFAVLMEEAFAQRVVGEAVDRRVVAEVLRIVATFAVEAWS